MPTTDLPDPNAYKGTAGFKWHPEGSTDRPEQVHALQWPPHLVPGGGYETRRKKYRATAESFDGSNIERFTVGSGNERARMPLRFDSWAESLGDLLEDAADGVTVDFYPRLESTNLKFPVELEDVGDVTRVRDDSDRHGFGEFEVESVWKDASTDDQGFWWMEGPNKLKNPRLARGTTDGVAEGWNKSGGISTGVTYTIDSNTRSQRIQATTSTTGTGNALIDQTALGFVPNDTVTLETGARVNRSSSGLSAAVSLRWVSSTGVIRTDTSTKYTSNRFGRLSLSSTAPNNTIRLVALLRLNRDSTSVTGSIRYRDAKLTLQ